MMGWLPTRHDKSLGDDASDVAKDGPLGGVCTGGSLDAPVSVTGGAVVDDA